MYDGARTVLGEDLVEPCAVADVATLQRTPAHRPLVAFLQRVVADRGEALLGERLADVAADIAGAAGDENFLGHRRYIGGSRRLRQWFCWDKEGGMQVWRRLARLWRRWRHPSGPEEPPALRLFFAPQAPWPSWHPTKAADGTPMLQIVVELEAANRTDRDIRIVWARLRDHTAEQTSFTVGSRRGGKFSKDHPVKPHSRAHIMLMF